MVRAPCCEKEGVKKGPWTPEEDQLLVAYVQEHGHDNWRKLPKKAGLLRCGKSCRLRWTNYLRPDIKRGNFTKEEESTIILLHQQLGNRWSAIAAKLPGRTDNEIKNVWHTHLKKIVGSNNGAQLPRKRKVRSTDTAAPDKKRRKKQQQQHTDAASCMMMPTKPRAIRLEPAAVSQEAVVQQQPAAAADHNGAVPVSPSNSFCSVFSSPSSSSSFSSSSSSSGYNLAGCVRTEGLLDSLEAVLLDVDDIDESFWSEAYLSLDSSTGAADHMMSDWAAAAAAATTSTISSSSSTSSSCLTSLPSPFDDSAAANCCTGGGDDVDDQMSYWLKVFMEAGDTMQEFY